jgi:hypothetical protein
MYLFNVCVCVCVRACRRAHECMLACHFSGLSQLYRHMALVLCWNSLEYIYSATARCMQGGANLNYMLHVWLEVLMAVTAKMAVFWVVASCRQVWVYQCFRGLYCLHHQGTLMMEAVQTSEMLVISYQSTWHYNPEDSHLCMFQL